MWRSRLSESGIALGPLTINLIIHISLSLLRTSKYLTLADFTSVTFANTLTRLVRQPTGKTVAAICYLAQRKSRQTTSDRQLQTPSHPPATREQTTRGLLLLANTHPPLPATNSTNTATMAQTETSINIPQLLAVALVGFFAIRWYLNKPPPSSPSGSNNNSSTSRANRGVDPAQITQVSAMFPQLDRRSIAWDLHRNGGNVAGTSERILTGRGLDNPPPSYQPVLPEPAVPVPSVSAGGARAGAGGQPDLITRYGLQGRIGDKGKEAVQSEEQKRSAWTSDKAARAEGLKRRREEMVLEARRKMLERDGRA